MHFDRETLDLGPAQLIRTKIVGARSDTQIVEHLEDYRRYLQAALQRRSKLVDILDTRQAAPPTAKQRRMQADWNAEQEELLRVTLVGFAFVVSSTVMRGIITAILWFKPLPIPHAVFTDLEDAVQWAFERLRQSGIQISSADREAARHMFGIQRIANMSARR